MQSFIGELPQARDKANKANDGRQLFEVVVRLKIKTKESLQCIIKFET